MKRSALLLILLCCSLLSFALPDKQLAFTKSFANYRIKKVTAQTSGGSIMLKSTAASDVHVDVYISGGSADNLSREEAEKKLTKYYNVRVRINGSEVEVFAKPKQNTTNFSVSFEIFMPTQIDSKLNTSGGSINIDGVSGTQEFGTSGGSLTVANIRGNTKGTTSGGSISVSNSQDNISLQTSGGSIKATNCKGNIDLQTSGGSLDLSQLDGKINASTSGGSMKGNDINGELIAHTSGGSGSFNNISGSIDASTSAGSITISMKSVNKYVKASTSAGTIDLSLPAGNGYDLNLAANKIQTGTLTNFVGNATDKKVEGKLAGGGIPVEAKASAGKITLKIN